MSLNIIVPHLFLPYSSVRLGRLITNIDHPHQHYHDPRYAKPPQPAIVPGDSFVGVSIKTGSTGFGSALTSLLSARFSKRAKTQVRITAEQIATYMLDNSDQLFDETTTVPTTRLWIERAIDRGEKDEDDIIEVEAIPLDNLDGEWDRHEVPGGQTLLIRAEGED
ncbi:hypothetical protein C7999DRAFT_17165 [Corynascus novoguineensis]|uniref:Uncharacterized protein n=1 Tax=Corynascus novoguineensis TaxID=1126955 RepID=A0AAN7CM13_9PEZI|nr:hypothetical protein C7999DRAFT_17165 [Corynascus novoguineensis]